MTIDDLKDHLDTRLDSQDKVIGDVHKAVYGTPDTPGIRERVGVLEDRSARTTKVMWGLLVALLAKIGIDLPF